MTGYSMETAEKIMGFSVVWPILERPEHIDYPAIAELYRQYSEGRYDPPLMLSAAVALGMAIGTRNERARRRREKVTPFSEATIKEAELELKKAMARFHMARKMGFTLREYRLGEICQLLHRLSMEELDTVYDFAASHAFG